jgi:hypothetical protein
MKFYPENPTQMQAYYQEDRSEDYEDKRDAEMKKDVGIKDILAAITIGFGSVVVDHDCDGTFKYYSLGKWYAVAAPHSLSWSNMNEKHFQNITWNEGEHMPDRAAKILDFIHDMKATRYAVNKTFPQITKIWGKAIKSGSMFKYPLDFLKVGWMLFGDNKKQFKAYL